MNQNPFETQPPTLQGTVVPRKRSISKPRLAVVCIVLIVIVYLGCWTARVLAIQKVLSQRDRAVAQCTDSKGHFDKNRFGQLLVKIPMAFPAPVKFQKAWIEYVSTYARYANSSIAGSWSIDTDLAEKKLALSVSEYNTFP